MEYLIVAAVAIIAAAVVLIKERRRVRREAARRLGPMPPEHRNCRSAHEPHVRVDWKEMRK